MLPQADAIAQLRTEVYAHFSELRTLQGYPAIAASQHRWLDTRAQPWCEFALLCCRLAGGCSSAHLSRVLSGWLILLGVSGPLDDYADEDKDLDGAWADLGWKRGNSVGLALIAEAVEIVLGDGAAPPSGRAAGVLLKRLREVALGQALDIAQVQTLEAYEQMLELKAAALTAALTEGVAMIAEADAPKRQALVACGWEVGMALQIVNDYLGVWQEAKLAKRPGGDLARSPLTYPMFYALSVPHPHRDEFRALLSQASGERDTARMLAILNAIGAPSFMRAAIEVRKKRALKAVYDIAPDEVAGFEMWCNRYLLGENR